MVWETAGSAVCGTVSKTEGASTGGSKATGGEGGGRGVVIAGAATAGGVGADGGAKGVVTTVPTGGAAGAGGGAIGSAVAYYLSKTGAKVVLVERQAIGSGSSSANPGAVNMITKKPGPALRLAQASQRLYPGLTEQLGTDVEYLVTGTLIVVFGAIYFPKVPTLGYVPFVDDPWASLSRMFWPALALGLGIGAIILRYTRSSVLEVLGEDYVRTARAKGLSEIVVVFVHALKSALIPIITAIGIWSAFLVSGAVILEEVFAIPGLGRLVLSAIENRDYPIIQGTVLFLSLGVALVILVADLLVALVDPRVKLG